MGVQLASVGRVGSLAAASITAIRTGRLHGDGHVSLLNVPMFHIAGIGGIAIVVPADPAVPPTLDDLTSWALGKMASYRSRPAS